MQHFLPRIVPSTAVDAISDSQIASAAPVRPIRATHNRLRGAREPDSPPENRVRGGRERDFQSKHRVRGACEAGLTGRRTPGAEISNTTMHPAHEPGAPGPTARPIRPMRPIRLILAAPLALLALALVACGDPVARPDAASAPSQTSAHEPDPAPGQALGANTAACLPGERLDCTCPDGSRHFRVCDGGAFPLCPCPDTLCAPDCVPTPCVTVTCPYTMGCIRTPRSFEPCDDGDPCTVSDTCLSGLCVGQRRDCDDHDACTRDACADGLCTHTPFESCERPPDTPASCGVNGVTCPGANAACEDGACTRCSVTLEEAEAVTVNGCAVGLRLRCPEMPSGRLIRAHFSGRITPPVTVLAQLQWDDGHPGDPSTSCIANVQTCPQNQRCGAPYDCARRFTRSTALDLALERVLPAATELGVHLIVRTVSGACPGPWILDAGARIDLIAAPPEVAP